MILPYERYLIILGYATRKERKKAILFKGFIFKNTGEIIETMQQTILQAVK